MEVLSSLDLKLLHSINVGADRLPVLFQYDFRTSLLFICCMNMTQVEAYRLKKAKNCFEREFELNNHAMPGVASLKIIDGFLLTGGYDSKLSVWNIEEKKLEREFCLNEPLVCFEQVSSSVLLIGGNANVMVFNVRENKVLSKNEIHHGPIWQLIYNCFSEVVVSGSCDCTVKVSRYKDEKLQVLHTFQQFNWSYGVCFLDPEHILTCGKDKLLRVYDVVQGKKVEEILVMEHDGDWISIDVKGKRAFISETNGLVHIFEEKNT